MHIILTSSGLDLTNLLILLCLRPTCKECTRVFPEACFNELRSYYDKPAIAKYQEVVTNRKLTRERLARQYCYLTYFGPVLGEDIKAMIPDWELLVLESLNEEDKASSDEDDASRDDVDDSSDSSEDDDDDDDGDDDDSSSRRRLLSARLPFRNRLTPALVQNFRNLEKVGSLTCPAPQCLTKHSELLESLVAPWYHTSGAGRCSFKNCRPTDDDDGPQWCLASAGNCIKCKATWCPPKAVPFWTKVNAASYEPLLPFYEDTGIARRFPRSACNYQPLTQISREDAKGLPWYDLAGDVFGIETRTHSPSMKETIKNTRDDYNADLLVEYEKQQKIEQEQMRIAEEKRRIAEEKMRIAEEKRVIRARLEAQRKARVAEVKRRQKAAAMAREAAAAEAARKRMEEEAKLRRNRRRHRPESLSLMLASTVMTGTSPRLPSMGVSALEEVWNPWTETLIVRAAPSSCLRRWR